VGAGAADVFVIKAANPAAVTITINGVTVPGSPFNLTSMVLSVFGNGGNDTFTLSGSGVVVNLDGGTETNSFTVSGWDGTGSLIGSGGADRVIATKDADLTLSNTLLTSFDGTTVMSLALSSIELNTLTVANDTTSRVIDASAFTGSSTLTASGAARAKLIGGNNNDTMTVTGTGSAVLVGRGGSDTLQANGNGRTVLIGGAAADTLTSNGGPSGNGQAILIGGATVYDLNLVALDRILDEWESGNTYNDRIDHLTNGTGLNNPFRLDATTILNDAAAVINIMTNLAATDNGQSWFLTRARDTVNKRVNDHRTVLLP